MATKKIKVLECIRQGQIGGGESHLLSVVENLNRSKYEPVVLSFTDGPMIVRLKEMGIKSHVISTQKPFDITKWKEVKRFLIEEGIDLVHAHGTRANSNVLWAARSLKIPVIYTIHGWSFHQDQHPLVRRIRILGEKYLTSHSTINISVSASNKQSGKAYLRRFESVVINNGIDHQKFSPSRLANNIRPSLDIAPDALLVLFIARFTKQKQPLILINAFLAALASFPEMHLLMVGDGDQKEEALKLAVHPELSGKISFLSFRQDVPDLLSAADIFVLPSLWEGLPIGLLEAMATGKAVIASGVDGTREIIEHGNNGLLVEPGNVDSLKNALLTVAKDESLRKRLQKNALETIQGKFSADYMTRQIEAVYESLCNTPNDV